MKLLQDKSAILFMEAGPIMNAKSIKSMLRVFRTACVYRWCYLAVYASLLFWTGQGTAGAQQWTSVDVGGGGRVTGIEADPHVNGLFYMRTDMGGVNKWNGSSWVPITDS